MNAATGYYEESEGSEGGFVDDVHAESFSSATSSDSKIAWAVDPVFHGSDSDVEDEVDTSFNSDSMESIQDENNPSEIDYKDSAKHFATPGGPGKARAKLAWVTKQNQLRQRAIAIERDVRLRLYNTNIDSVRPMATSLLNEHDRLDRARETQCNDVLGRLSRVQQSTLRLKKQVDLVVSDERVGGGIHALHAAFDNLESEFDHFKKLQRAKYNELTNAENVLDKDIFEMNKRVLLWEKADEHHQHAWATTPTKHHLKRSRVSTGKNIPRTVGNIVASDNRPTELVELERQIASDGGTTGNGWTAKDHALFLRLLSKYQLRNAVSWIVEKSEGDSSNMPSLSRVLQDRLEDMFAAAQEKLPLTTAEAIREHWTWHCVHECRIEMKKRLVKQWRERKKSTVSSNIATPTNFDESADAATPSKGSISARQSRQIEEARRRKEKAALLEWKKDKEREQIALAKQKKMHEREKILASRREREERIITKEHLAMYKLQKESEKARREAIKRVIQTAQGRGPQRAPSRNVLMQNHERNMKKLQLEKEAKKAKELAAIQRKQKLRELAQSVAPKAVHVDVTRETAAAMRRRFSQQELDDRERARREARAHHTGLHSATGAEHSRGRSYTFSTFSGTRTPNWCKGMRG